MGFVACVQQNDDVVALYDEVQEKVIGNLAILPAYYGYSRDTSLADFKKAYFAVFVHGGPTSVFPKQNIEVAPASFAAYLKGFYNTIRGSRGLALFSCYTGSAFAMRLSQALSWPVLAPTKPAIFWGSGKVEIIEGDASFPGHALTKEWRLFRGTQCQVVSGTILDTKEAIRLLGAP